MQPHRAEAYELRGDAYAKLQNVEAALANYAEALKYGSGTAQRKCEELQAYWTNERRQEAERQRQAEEQRKAAEAKRQQEEAERQRLISQTTGADYSELDRALRNRQWQEADELTRTLMLKVMNTSGYLNADEIRRFPGEDLKRIDRLWVDHSDGKLGFSVQKRIWQECGSPGPDYEANKAAWKKFGQRVNWQGGTAYDGWRYTSELDMTNPQKYPGHLPLWVWLGAEGWFWVRWLGGVLFSRAEI
ncbi:MAG: hypothetical protein HC918_13455 [Oscillatoriales cyanobacterium SM2_1_8]|nr:hypothetical protein [Oscillatoriales cyanobacterium SM2_1_8]